MKSEWVKKWKSLLGQGEAGNPKDAVHYCTLYTLLPEALEQLPTPFIYLYPLNKEATN